MGILSYFKILDWSEKLNSFIKFELAFQFFIHGFLGDTNGSVHADGSYLRVGRQFVLAQTSGICHSSGIQKLRIFFTRGMGHVLFCEYRG
jgi:hypothetical protein